MKKLLLAFFSFFFAFSAFSQNFEGQQCKEYSLSLDGPYQSDKEAVCREAVRKCDSSAYYSCDYLSSDGDSCVYSNYTEDRTFRYSNVVRPFFSRKCEENKCSAKNGSLTWQYVPMGKIKITDLEKGTYDFKRVPPPAKVCFEGCEAGSPGKYVGVMGMRGVDLENTDSNGYHTTFSNIEYTFTGNLCIEGEHNIPGKPPEKLPENEEEKCKGKGGYFGQVNGKDVCLGVDEENKCLPGQTYGQINGKDVCLTPEGEKLPVPVPGDKNQPGTGNDPSGDGSGGNGKGNGNAGNGQGNGSGGGGGGGGSGPYGNGKGDGEGEGEGECAKHPDRLGCLKLGEADGDKQLGRDERNVKFEPKDLRLPTSCPAPRRFSLSGMKWEIRFDFLCQVADTARPFVILMATFFTVVMVVGGVRKK